jgi:hypothetical protein
MSFSFLEWFQISDSTGRELVTDFFEQLLGGKDSILFGSATLELDHKSIARAIVHEESWVFV